MKVSFTGFDLSNKVKEYQQKQYAKSQAKWDRKKCNIGFFALSSALLSMAVTPLILKSVVNKYNPKIHLMALDAWIGGSILAIGTLGGYIFNKIDEKKNTKLGNFTYKFFNLRESIEKNDLKVDTKA